MREWCKAELLPLIEEWKAHVKEELGKSVKESVAAGNKTVFELLEAVRQTVQDNQATMDEKIMSVVRPQPPPRVPAGFDRDTGGTIAVAMSQKHTTAAHVRETLQPFISGLGYEATECEIKASGDEPSKRFAVAFKGTVAPATRKAHTILQNLKVDKQWREFTVGVSGSSDCRLFLGPDKSPKQIKTEILLRRCRSEIASVYPQAKLFSDRERGCLLVGWDKTLKVEAGAGQDDSKLQWEPNRITKNNMDIE
ncbi:unnamed protein product, partial [Prorocentrum cordatum]